MAKALIAEKPTSEVLECASRRLKASREELLDALQGELTDSHRFMLDELMRHIEEIEARIARFDARLLDGLAGEHNALVLLQTLPGINRIGAAMLLVEIGTDMAVFGSADCLASRVGVCPGNNESAGKRKSGRVRKGTPLCGRCASSPMPPAVPSRSSSRRPSRWRCGADTRVRSSPWLRTLFFMPDRHEHYRNSAADYEALAVQRNALRWIKALTRFGFIPAAA